MSEETAVLNSEQIELDSSVKFVNGNDVAVESTNSVACEVSEDVACDEHEKNEIDVSSEDHEKKHNIDVTGEEQNNPKIDVASDGHEQKPKVDEPLVICDEKSNDRNKMPPMVELPKNKIRIIALHFPEDYSSSCLMDLMKEARSFHMWFERDSNKKDQVKKGGISLTFDDELSAKQAYRKTKNVKINGAKLKVHAAKSFDEQSPPPQSTSKASDAATSQSGDAELHQKIYVSQLLPTTDDDLIYAVFGKENLKSIDIFADPKRKDGTKVAILTFLTAELAEQSKEDYDGFVVDDGELSKPMKILSYVDFLTRKNSDKGYASPVKDVKQKLDNETNEHLSLIPTEESVSVNLKPKNDVSESESLTINDSRGKAGTMWSAQIVESRLPETSVDRNGNTEKPSANATVKKPPAEDEPHEPLNQPQFSGELSLSELQVWINYIVDRDRINWAELNTLEDLWVILNNVVKETGWQPEYSLKEAMLHCLEAAKSIRDVDWWQNHMRFLIRLWTKEAESETRSKARVKLQLNTDSEPQASLNTDAGVVEPEPEKVVPGADYVGPPKSPKSKRKTGKKALMELMGVGALLASVQQEAAASNAAAAVASPSPVPSKSRERRDTPESNKKEQISPKKLQSRESKNKRARKSSCESGEASTTSPSEKSDLSSEESGSRKSRHRENRRKRRRHRQRRRSSSSGERSNAASSTAGRSKKTAASTSGVQQVDPNAMASTWMNQAMPAFVQMMPMMMQMCQMRMMSMSQPQQQQMMQQFQQQFAQMNQQVRADNPSQHSQQQQSQQQMSFNPAEMMAQLQRMSAANAAAQQPNGAAGYSPNVHTNNANYESPRHNAGYNYPGYHRNY